MTRRCASGLATFVTLLSLTSCGGSPGGPGPITPPPPSQPANVPPTIESIALGAERAEVGEEITVTATVRDPETAVAQLQYAWTADGGTFSGEGASVRWRPPADRATPAEYTMRLTVTETYGNADASGVRPTHVVAATSTGSVRVHNSPGEIGALALGFLREFATSTIPADIAVRNFTDSCRGKSDERSEVADNRVYYEILGSSLNLVNTSVAPSRLAGTARVACGFTSRIKACQPGRPGCVVGATEKVAGDCVLTTVYEQRRWWLCTSTFENGVTLPSTRWLFGAPR